MPIRFPIYYRTIVAYGELSNLLSEATLRQIRCLAEVKIENPVLRPSDIPAHGRLIFEEMENNVANRFDPRSTMRPQLGAAGVGQESFAYHEGLRSYMLSVYNYMASGVLLTGVGNYPRPHLSRQAVTAPRMV